MSRVEERDSSSVFLSRIVEPIEEDLGEFILLGAFLIVAMAFYIQAQSLDRADSKTVPLLILYFFTVMIFFTAFMELFGDRIEQRLGLSGTESAFGFQDEESLRSEEEEEAAAALFELNPINVLKHFLWICVYLLCISYIGFWTANALFIFAYVMVNERSPLPRRFAYAVLWGAFLLLVMWILFVELLNIVAIWRLGPFP